MEYIVLGGDKMMRKYPFVKQEGLKDCAPACLLMMIQYYKGSTTLEYLREKMYVTKNGTTAYNLMETATKFGFHCTGVKTDLDHMNSKNMVLPCIAHFIVDQSYQHFVVIYEIDYKKKKMLIADPANKIQKISFIQFQKLWDHVLIFLYPQKTIPILHKTPSFFEYIFTILKLHHKILSQIILLSLWVTFFSIVISFFFKYMVDSIMFGKDHLQFVWIIFVNFYLLKVLSDAFRNHLLLYANQKMDMTMTFQIVSNILSLPYHYYRNRTTGEILSRITDLNQVKESMIRFLITVFIDFPLAFVSFFCMYVIDSKLCFIALLQLVLYGLVWFLSRPFLQKRIDVCQEQRAQTTSYLVETISGFESVKGLGIEQNRYQHFEKKYISLLKKIFQLGFYNNIQYVVKDMIYQLGFMVMIYFGCQQVMDKQLTLGSLLAFQSLLTYFLEPMKNIIDMDIQVKETKNAVKRVLELTMCTSDEGVIEDISIQKIVIQRLNYVYSHTPILQNICLQIYRGEKIMVIGESGGGKSTFLQILMKYHSIERNQVFINDIDLNDYKKIAIHKDMLYVAQNGTLWNGTLLENISFHQDINQLDLLEIADICGLQSILDKSPLGWNQMIEENGFNLSGGERQRIMLARALLRNTSVLFIDEGFSQIDSNLERKILKKLFQKYTDKMIVIVSHRLENMDLYHRVVEIRKGEIVNNATRNSY